MTAGRGRGASSSLVLRVMSWVARIELWADGRCPPDALRCLGQERLQVLVGIGGEIHPIPLIFSSNLNSSFMADSDHRVAGPVEKPCHPAEIKHHAKNAHQSIAPGGFKDVNGCFGQAARFPN